MNDFFYHAASDEHKRKERAKARELRASQWWRQQIGPGICHHCGEKFDKKELTMDHLTPVARGGGSTKNNVVPSCKACNTKRGAKMDVELNGYLETSVRNTTTQ